VQSTEFGLGVEVRVAITLAPATPPAVSSNFEELGLKEHSALEKFTVFAEGSSFTTVNVTVEIPVMSKSIRCPLKEPPVPIVKGRFDETPVSQLGL
jgi:hypothetical protein